MRAGGVRRWWSRSVAAISILLVGSSGAAGSAQAAGPATVSGTLTGARLPKAADGGAFVTATSLKDWSIVGATRVGPGGRYTLKLPKGDYALSSTLVRRAATQQNAFPVRLRAGQRLRQPLTLKRVKKKRTRARGSGVNKYGYSYPGTAFGVDHFHGATGEARGLNNGLPSMLIVDLLNYSVHGDRSAGCTLTQVEWMHRQDLVDEIALSQTKWVDPKTALSGHKLIDPELLVGGDITVSGPAANPKLLITAHVTETKTGAIRGTTTLQTTAASFSNDIGRLADQVARALCHPPPTPPPSPSPRPTPTTPPTSYMVDVNITGAFAPGTNPPASGTVHAAMSVPRTGVGFWSATGQTAYSDASMGPDLFTGCPYDSLTSGNPDWNVKIESDLDGATIHVLTWAPQPTLIGTQRCPQGDPYVTPGLSLLWASAPASFRLPIAGGTQQVSSSDPATLVVTGTVTVTARY